ncbi:carbohydrate binding domain-containing protein, partial [bacterium]|nr:carbohydrate binding domain-containing protein [bacterium]
MRSKNQLMYLIIACVALLVVSGVCAYATNYAGNLIPDPNLENLTVGTTATQSWSFENWIFFATPDSGGSMEVVSTAQSGSKAIKLTRTSTSGDTAFGMNGDHSLQIPVIPGHRYIAKVWAMSPDGATIKFQVASFNNNPDRAGWIGDTAYADNLPTKSTWTLYQMTYEAPANALYAGVAVRVKNANTNLYVDSFSLEDITAMTSNRYPDPSFDSFVAGDTYTANPTYIGGIKFFATSAGCGSIAGITPGHTGDTAVRLARLTTAGDVGFGLQGRNDKYFAQVPITGGHTYRISFWARSDDSDPIRWAFGYADAAKASVSGGIDTVYTPSTTWTQFSGDYIAPSSAAYVGLGFRPCAQTAAKVRSVDFDDISVVDITPTSALTGTVTSGVTGQPISGATVTVSSATQTITTTTDSSGVYTFSGISGGMWWNVTTSANGYTTWHSTPDPSEYNVAVLGTITQNIVMMPDTSWAITDTFTRSAGTDLGHTEDANAIPWVKTTGNTSSTIDTTDATAGRLRFDVGASACGASLGRGFTPADFDVSVDMAWDINQLYSVWAAFAYRQTTTDTYNQGYFLKCPYTDGDGNTTLELYYNDGTNSTKLGSGTIQTSYLWGDGATLR